MLDTTTIRGKFPYLNGSINLMVKNTHRPGRIFVDSTASTQMPLPVLERLAGSLFHYANIHRGEYDSSRLSTLEFERAYNIAANLVNADSWREIVMGRNATEMINLVMRGTAAQFRDGDNVVVTRLEHNSNYVPWFGLQGMLKNFGRSIEVRIVDFDRATGELNMDQFARKVDSKTKIVAATGASNFMGIKPDLKNIANLAHSSRYEQPDGSKGSYFLVDGAQLVPGSHVDVQDIDCDFLAWSFHKMAIPLGVGALYGKKSILDQLDPFLYGGDMVAKVREGNVTYKQSPWKFTAGTPNILGTIGTGYGITFMINLGLGNLFEEQPGTNGNSELLCRQIATEILLNTPRGDTEIMYDVPEIFVDIFGAYLAENDGLEGLFQDQGRRLTESRNVVRSAMNNIMYHEQELTQRAIDGLKENGMVTLYGPLDATKRTGLLAFNVRGMNPQTVAMRLNEKGIEVRHGTLCAQLAQQHCGIEESARMSFYVYNTIQDVDRAVAAVNDLTE